MPAHRRHSGRCAQPLGQPKLAEALLLPDPREQGSMDPRIRTVFLAMLVGFTGLFWWLLSLRTRFARVERRRLEAAA